MESSVLGFSLVWIMYMVYLTLNFPKELLECYMFDLGEELSDTIASIMLWVSTLLAGYGICLLI